MDLDSSFTPTTLIYGLIACILAISIGVFLAKKQARKFSGQAQGSGDLPGVTFFDYGDMRFLHLGTPWVQGSMKINKPFDIHLEYVQRMMGWLLFTDLNQVSHLHAMQLGLGAASLTKFCHHHLDMQTTAIELNPQVITACRRWFNLPEDDAKLHVVLGDAAEVSAQAQWHGKIDALQVDLSDQDAAYPVLDSKAFYTDCRQLLTDNGCMTVNLFGRSANLERSLQNIAHAFGKDALWTFKRTKAGNTIALAFRTPRVVDKSTMLSQAKAIEARWPLPATKWLKALMPVKKET
jgi:spermidine synthase